MRTPRRDPVVPAGSIASAIIELRVLADPDIGIDESQEAEAVRQVLAFLETQAGALAAALTLH